MPHKVLVVDDEPMLLRLYGATLKRGGFQVTTEARSHGALDLIRTEPWDVVLLDINMPEIDGLEILRQAVQLQADAEFIMLTGEDHAASAVEALRTGALDYVTKPVSTVDLIAMVNRATAHRTSTEHIGLPRPPAFKELVTIASNMLEVFGRIERLAPTTEDLLISGPTGSGKELLAKGFHQLSGCQGPFVGVNVAALPETLFAAQLFGHVSGAYSGASASGIGFFEEAARGTLLLDEICSLSLPLQAVLLRVLEEREFYPVGRTTPRPLRARLVFSTNSDLRELVAQGRFRQDLYYRISSSAVEVPRLADRLGDIPVLVAHFTRRFARAMNRPARTVQPSTIKHLLACSFPGNVRELKNVIREAVLAEETLSLRPSSLPPGYRCASACGSGSPCSHDDMRPLEDMERRYIEQVLEATSGNVSQASRVLGISRATLNRRLKSYNQPTAAPLPRSTEVHS